MTALRVDHDWDVRSAPAWSPHFNFSPGRRDRPLPAGWSRPEAMDDVDSSRQATCPNRSATHHRVASRRSSKQGLGLPVNGMTNLSSPSRFVRLVSFSDSRKRDVDSTFYSIFSWTGGCEWPVPAVSPKTGEESEHGNRCRRVGLFAGSLIQEDPVTRFAKQCGSFNWPLEKKKKKKQFFLQPLWNRGHLSPRILEGSRIHTEPAMTALQGREVARPKFRPGSPTQPNRNRQSSLVH